MKIAHWVLHNNSGMFNMAKTLCEAEKKLGSESFLVNTDDASTHEVGEAADLHVVHTHCSDNALHSGKPLVWVAHGTPEVMFHSGYEQGLVNGGYGHGDAWMMAQFWLQRCDAAVTFWPRHAALWRSLCDKRTRVEVVPMGIDPFVWRPADSAGRFVGAPSVLTAENCYEIKWPLDLFLAWPFVVADPKLHGARLHAIYVPKDQHRWWFPLVNRNGASYHAYIGADLFDAGQLRNAFCSTDFYIGLVRYGDFNRTALEASSSGAKVISYEGNPFADFWVHEGDQRRLAAELTAILRGEVEPRAKDRIATVDEMAKAMLEVYATLH